MVSGVEAAFTSTTTDRDVALGYAHRKSVSGRDATPMLFEMRQGMVDRGAELGWLSQYPHEREVLFAPLTCVELRRSRVEGFGVEAVRDRAYPPCAGAPPASA